MNMQIKTSQIPVDTSRTGQESLLSPVATKHVSGKVTMAAKMPEVDMAQLLEASAKFFQQHNQHLSFTVDDSSGRTVVSVIDSDTAEVIRQIPNEEMLEISRRLQHLLESQSPSDPSLLLERSV